MSQHDTIDTLFEDEQRRALRRMKLFALLREISEDDPDFMDRIAAIFSGERQANKVKDLPPDSAATPRKKGGKLKTKLPSLYDTIRAWLSEHSNEYATIDKIVAGIGGNKNSIQHLLYFSRKSDFDQLEPAEGERGKRFRLAKFGGRPTT